MPFKLGSGSILQDGKVTLGGAESKQETMQERIARVAKEKLETSKNGSIRQVEPKNDVVSLLLDDSGSMIHMLGNLPKYEWLRKAVIAYGNHYDWKQPAWSVTISTHQI